jgi:DNA-binding FadR family transcriptional regulator
METLRSKPPEARTRRAPLRRGLKEQLVDAIGGDIISGRYPPGTLLPSEGSLLAQFSVSRTVLREAMTVLSAKGLIEVRQKRGTMVRPDLEWNQLDPAIIRWSGDPGGEWAGGHEADRIDQLIEIRHIVEPAAAALAAQRARPDDLDRMRAAYAAMESAGDDTQAFMDADLAFHLACLRASGNVFLQPIAHAIRSAMKTSLQVTSRDPHANLQVSLPLHRAILDAVLARDAKAATQAMTAHLADIPNRRNGFVRSAKRPVNRESIT